MHWKESLLFTRIHSILSLAVVVINPNAVSSRLTSEPTSSSSLSSFFAPRGSLSGSGRAPLPYPWLLFCFGCFQRKIISGYAAMLRRHNPGLASKVSLDDKGRLKVFKVDEATRKWEKRERHRMRHKLGGRREIDGLQVFCTSRTTTVS